MAPTAPPHAELLCRSAFSFHEGASSPEELVDRAIDLGLSALALTDRDGVYGLPRAWRRVKEHRREGRDLQLVAGARLTVEGGPGLVLLARCPEGWSNLCQIITQARCDGELDPDHDGASPHGRPRLRKGRARVALDDVLVRSGGLDAIAVGDWSPGRLCAARQALGDGLSLAISRRLDSRDEERVAALSALSRAAAVPLLATADGVMHVRARKRLADVLTCIRLGCTVDDAGRRLDANAERFLRGSDEMAALFHDLPEALVRARQVAARCAFTLDDLRYRYPREVVPEGWTAIGWLRELTARGLAWRYPAGPPPRIRAMADHELDLIEKLDFPAYFLTVYDAVRYARSVDILCQGRGSAANSVVCFALGVTAVDPTSTQLLFERFISEERGEPPDIDVDFEHERREEVIQYIFQRYGRHRAAMVCNIITYRRRSALRDTGKALGLSQDQVDRLAKEFSWWDKGKEVAEARLREAGLDPTDPRVLLTAELAGELTGMPRHLGVHSGGFAISDQPMVGLCPIEPATMLDRTVLQWDKDDIDVVGFVKVDVLALGMLTAIRRCFDLVAGWTGQELGLADVPADDVPVYDMLCKADSVGVFQIESRAQMSMLPRLKPRNWYDLVVEVSLVRPGPIQGGMVHPYLAARRNPEAVQYAHPALEPILERTFGVPIFQEQVMAMAVAVGGFTPGQADALRRAMGAWRKRGGLEPLVERLMDGMMRNGITGDYAARIAKQIEGFGEYGFPESHAASFAHLVYVSSWLKCHWPGAFTCALLNSQPMGFYSPRSLVADARRHGVRVLPVQVQKSDWDSRLEPTGGRVTVLGHDLPEMALRLGFRLIKGLPEAAGRAIVTAREQGGEFQGIGDLARRAGLRRDLLARLARADALAPFGLDRRKALWAVEGLYDMPLFAGLMRDEGPPPLRAPSPEDELAEDFGSVGLSLLRDPAGLVREELGAMGYETAADILQQPDGAVVKAAGIVSNRQRPGTASGIVFMTLEDETGMLNLVIKPKLLDAQRKLILGSNLLRVTARVQREGDSISLLALRFRPFDIAAQVGVTSRDFR